MFEDCGAQAPARSFAYQAAGSLALAQLLLLEAAREAESETPQPFRRDQFGDVKHHVRRVALRQIPGVALQLVADAVGETFGSEQVDPGIAPDIDPQQRIETEQVVHVHVRHGHGADPQQVSRRERRKVAAIEQHRLPLVGELDEQRRIAEAAVDQSRAQGGAHSGSRPGTWVGVWSTSSTHRRFTSTIATTSSGEAKISPIGPNSIPPAITPNTDSAGGKDTIR